MSVTVDRNPTARQWYVTASDRTVRRTRPGVSGVREVPFGVGHVRQVGAAFTACGQPALDWPIFWDLSVDDPDDMCPDCRWTAVVDDRLPSGNS